MENNHNQENTPLTDKEVASPQLQPDLEPKSKNSITINKWYLIIGICIAIIAGLLVYILLGNKNDKKPVEKEQTTQVPISKEDTATAKDSIEDKVKKYEEGEEGYEPFTKSYVIANSAYLRTSPEIRQDNTVELVKFGAELYVEDYYDNNSGGQFHKVYKTKPDSKNNNLSYYYIAASTLVEQYYFDKFKKAFSLEPFSQLDSKTKQLVLDNDYSDSKQYAPSQNASRALKCIAYGDFDNDGIQDVAIILDNIANQYSRLLVMCSNKVTKEPYLAYSENFYDYYMIRSFKKGAKVYRNTENLTPALTDGLIIYTDSDTYGLMWNNDKKKFLKYNQESSNYYNEE